MLIGSVSVFLAAFVFNLYSGKNADAQNVNHIDVVTAVLERLKTEGLNASGPCGGLYVTNAVAIELQNQGESAAGILSKPTGNNCTGYAQDIIVYRDGSHYDILDDGENLSRSPRWNYVGLVDPDRWRPPVDPSQIPIQPPPPDDRGNGRGNGGGTNGGGGTQPQPQPETPQIIGIDSNSARPGQSVEMIGIELGDEITLTPLTGGGATKIPASLNPQKTRATFILPSDIALGAYRVSLIREGGQEATVPNFLTVSADAPLSPTAGPSSSEGFGQLIEKIFRWALALVGLAVFVNFLWAGFLWFTAAGRAGQISEAKEKMTNAIIGAIIFLASYLILKTINPDLVRSTFTLPGIQSQPAAPAGGQVPPPGQPSLPNSQPSGSTQIESLTTRNLGEGVFPDPVFFNDKIWLAYQNGNNLNLYSGSPDSPGLSDLTLFKSFPLGSGAGAFARLTVYSKTLWLAYREGEPEQNLKLWRMDQDITENLGGAWGNNPFALGNGYIAWQKDNPRSVYIRRLIGDTKTTVRSSLPTGITRILPNGSVKMQDEEKEIAINGRNYTKPWYAGNMVIAENGDNGLVGSLKSGTEFRIFSGQKSFDPHVSTDGGNFYAVSAWGPGSGVRIAILKTR